MLRSFLAPFALLVVFTFALPACVTVENDDEVRTNAIIEGEVARRIEEIQYMQGDELMQNLARLIEIGVEAHPQLRAALKTSKDSHTRGSIVYVFGIIGDRRNIEYIRPMLEDDSPKVRYETAAVLVEMGDAEGFPVLVDGLADADVRWRFKCFQTLQAATGQDFGYVHNAEPELREDAVARWNQWLREIRSSAL